MTFNEVKTKDRLPNKSGEYFVYWTDTYEQMKKGGAYFILYEEGHPLKEWEEDNWKKLVDTWLEPIKE